MLVDEARSCKRSTCTPRCWSSHPPPAPAAGTWSARPWAPASPGHPPAAALCTAAAGGPAQRPAPPRWPNQAAPIALAADRPAPPASLAARRRSVPAPAPPAPCDAACSGRQPQSPGSRFGCGAPARAPAASVRARATAGACAGASAEVSGAEVSGRGRHPGAARRDGDVVGGGVPGEGGVDRQQGPQGRRPAPGPRTPSPRPCPSRHPPARHQQGQPAAMQRCVGLHLLCDHPPRSLRV